MAEVTRYPVTPHPFESPKSFYDIGTGAETLKLKPEWAHIKERDMGHITDFELELHTRKDGSHYVSIGDPANGPHQQFDFYGSDDLAVAVAMRFNSHASLVEEVERLREACSALLAHWDKNDGKEKRGEFEGIPYWSPAGRMVDTDFIVAIREALEKYNA